MTLVTYRRRFCNEKLALPNYHPQINTEGTKKSTHILRKEKNVLIVIQ